MAEPLVRMRDVFCVHRTPEGDAAALQGASLVVERGELVCVLGPSGAGKSTLLRVIAGLQPPSAGTVHVDGQDIGRLRARERAHIRHAGIGFMGESLEAALSPDVTAEGVVALPLALRGIDRAARRRRVAALLGQVGLADRAGARAPELSGGERQRVALCAALAHRPRLLLADEPTGELDSSSAAAVRTAIRALARAEGAAVVLVSHDPDSPALADRTVHIRDGRIAIEVRDGQETLVVGPGGWVQLPDRLVREAGLGARVRARARERHVVLEPVVSAETPGPVPGTVRVPAEPAPWRPAAVRAVALSRERGRGPSRRSVLRALSLAVEPGSFTAVTGRSGSGKSTLLRLLAGLDQPDAGTVMIDNEPLSELDPEARSAVRRERLGYVAQDPAPVGFLSAMENIVLALRLRGWPSAEAARRAVDVLGRVDLAPRSRQRVARLSAGETQRVAVARALAVGRGLLILDEPTSRLDAAGGALVGQALRLAAEEEHQTVIVATHEPEVIRRADQVVAL